MAKATRLLIKNGTLIDGSGGDPVPNRLLVIVPVKMLLTNGPVGTSSVNLDGAGDEDPPGFGGIEKAVVGSEGNFGLVDLDHALQRLALRIDHRTGLLSHDRGWG